ncbi:MAG: NAD(+)/NADH kinase [Spirochaetes bacterium]|nr:NAD(+)/NADH kinase [Spirochaetota bacterium]
MDNKSRKSILIVANLLKDDAAGLGSTAAETLEKRGWEVEIFGFEGKPMEAPDFSGRDLILSLGGDGTLLYVARLAAPLGVPILPVNLGTLGFIAANRRESWLKVLDAWDRGLIAVSKRMMLKISVFRSGTLLGSSQALNDGVVSSQGRAKMVRLGLDVNGERFGFYRADGIIVATATGSTAYNLAAGGPALHPEMPAMVINPICPFTLASRPLVLPGSGVVEVSIVETRRSGALLTVDGQETTDLCQGDIVRFEKAASGACLVLPPEDTFLEALRSKLGWSGDMHA